MMAIFICCCGGEKRYCIFITEHLCGFFGSQVCIHYKILGSYTSFIKMKYNQFYCVWIQQRSDGHHNKADVSENARGWRAVGERGVEEEIEETK